jgi:hypothetical protein
MFWTVISRILFDRDRQSTELLEDDAECFVDVVDTLGTGTDDLPRPEDQGGGLRFLCSVDESREVIGVEIRSWKVLGESFEIELLTDSCRCDHVLDFDGVCRHCHLYFLIYDPPL